MGGGVLKMKWLVISFFCFFCCNTFANKALMAGQKNVWWHGKADFSGEVVSPACSLFMEDAWQTINMGDVSIKNMKDDIISEKKVYIRLTNCDVRFSGDYKKSSNRISTSFDGVVGTSPDSFFLTGSASGLTLKILDNDGYIFAKGKTSPRIRMDKDFITLEYSVQVIPSGERFSAGEYASVLRYHVYYE